MHAASLKYLKNYGAQEAALLLEKEDLPLRGDHCLMVPLCEEALFLPAMVESLFNTKAAKEGSLVVVFTLNQSSVASLRVAKDNMATKEWLLEKFPKFKDLHASPPIWLGKRAGVTALVVERFEGPYVFKEKEGVGLARKIGGDIGLCLYLRGKIKSDFLHHTDGDARLCEDYFDISFVKKETKSLVYGFKHVKENASTEAFLSLKIYEMWLRYYRLSLAKSGSPYGVHAVGSLMAMRADTYAEVRGFPRRQAGEDFYLLGKLLKAGPLETLHTHKVELACRESQRVPFGTGQGTLKIMDLRKNGEELKVLPPEAFLVLERLLTGCRLILHGEPKKIFDFFSGDWDGDGDGDWDGDKEEVLKVVDSFNFDKALMLAKKRAKDAKGAVRQFHNWFDGFKTLKFLHQLRDACLPAIGLSKALEINGFSDASRRITGDDFFEQVRLVDEMFPKTPGFFGVAKKQVFIDS